MSINQRSEIEAKFRLGPSLDDLAVARRLIVENGYQIIEQRIETDYLPDTKDSALKQAKLLLRFREVTRPNDCSIILTLKIRNETSRLNHFHEIETKLDETDTETVDHIRKIVQDKSGLTIPNLNTRTNSLQVIVRRLQKEGFERTRILLDKYREEYLKEKVHVTLDFFPDGMGSFLEVEGYAEDDVVNAYKMLGFSQSQHLTDDYGDLLKEHKKHLDDPQSRQALFSLRERTRLLRLLHDA